MDCQIYNLTEAYIHNMALFGKTAAQWRAVKLLGQQVVAQLTQIPCGHNIAIISKCKNLKKEKLVWAEMT